VVEGYTPETIQRSLEFSTNDYTDVMGKISQFTDGNDLSALESCALAHGMLPDTKQAQGASLH